jgi:hypothetical protein
MSVERIFFAHSSGRRDPGGGIAAGEIVARCVVSGFSRTVSGQRAVFATPLVGHIRRFSHTHADDGANPAVVAGTVPAPTGLAA